MSRNGPVELSKRQSYRLAYSLCAQASALFMITVTISRHSATSLQHNNTQKLYRHAVTSICQKLNEDQGAWCAFSRVRPEPSE